MMANVQAFIHTWTVKGVLCSVRMDRVVFFKKFLNLFYFYM